MGKQKGPAETWQLVLIGLLFLIIIVSNDFIQTFKCRSRWEVPGLETRYKTFKGCFIRHTNESWLSEKDFVERNIKGK